MHRHTSLTGPPGTRACDFSTQPQCRAFILVARSRRVKHAEDDQPCATQCSAQIAKHAYGVNAAPGRAAPPTAMAADATAFQRSVAGRPSSTTSNWAKHTSGAVQQFTPSLAVGASADAAAHAAALTALQLHPHMAAAFMMSSTNQGLRGTGISITSKNKWTVVLSRNVQRRKITFRRSYGPVADADSCLVAAAAADLAHLAVYGRDKILDAPLPSIFGDALGRSRLRLQANLPLALYGDEDIQTWRALLQLEQPDITLHAVNPPVTSAAAQPQVLGAALQRQSKQLHQQNSTRIVPTAPTGLNKPSAALSEPQQRKLIRAAAAAAVATAVQRVLQHAKARPGTVANSVWAFEQNPKPPKGSCVGLRRGDTLSTWRARITLAGKGNGKTEFEKHCRSPLEAAVAADLARLALHGRNQPSTSSCLWNFPKGLYTKEQVQALGRLIQQVKPDVVLSGMGEKW